MTLKAAVTTIPVKTTGGVRIPSGNPNHGRDLLLRFDPQVSVLEPAARLCYTPARCLIVIQTLQERAAPGHERAAFT